MKGDQPNDLFDTFRQIGLPAGDGIDPLLRERLCRAAAPDSEPRQVDAERGKRRQNHDDDETHEPRKVGGAATDRNVPDDHGEPPHAAMREGIETVFSAVRSTPPASRREFSGRGFGKPSKPSDRARAKSRKRWKRWSRE